MVYYITLKKIESVQEAKLYKENGNQFFKENQFTLAIKIYEKAARCMENLNSNECKLLKADIFANIALCYSDLDNNFAVKKAVSENIAVD